MKNIPCRTGCGACCIAPSLSSEIPGTTRGKAAGERCGQLSEENLCRIYGRPGRPDVCSSYEATIEFCGKTREEALFLLTELERVTSPGTSLKNA